MRNSLKKQVLLKAKADFPDLFDTSLVKGLISIKNRVNSPIGALWMILLVAVIYIIGSLPHLPTLSLIPFAENMAETIIDQRATNMAAIFSLTLVVIGWLITNVSVKDSLSYQFLFKRSYLYPIFYFIATLLASLILISLWRKFPLIDLPNLVVAASYLIIGAIVAIVFLFVRLIEVVDNNFFYQMLEKEVLRESNPTWSQAVVNIYGRKLYREYMSQCDINAYSDNSIDVSSYRRIAIGEPQLVDENEESEIGQLFPSPKHYVDDIKIGTLSKLIKKVNDGGPAFFSPIGINSAIHTEFVVLYFSETKRLNKMRSKAISKCYTLKPIKPIAIAENRYLSILNERLLKDVKDQKPENVDKALAIYKKILSVEKNINSAKLT